MIRRAMNNIADAVYTEVPRQVASGMLSGDAPITILTGMLEPYIPDNIKGNLGHKYLMSMGWFKNPEVASQLYLNHKTVIDQYAGQISVENIVRFWKDPISQTLTPYLVTALVGVTIGAIGYKIYTDKKADGKKDVIEDAKIKE